MSCTSVTAGRPRFRDGELWRLWVDTGGTFTDCLALDPAGGLQRIKVLSSGALRGVVGGVAADGLDIRWPYRLPDGFLDGADLRLLDGGPTVRIERFTAPGRVSLRHRFAAGEGQRCEVRTGEEAPILAARLATGTTFGEALPPAIMRLATTRATNALLERTGSPTALFITRGFADLLEIADQRRSELFTLEIRKPLPFYSDVVEVEERLAADGTVLSQLAKEPLAAAAERLVAANVGSAAVALLHSYRNEAHEQAVKRVLLRRGFRHVSCSAELSPLIRILPRAETAVVDAYLSEIIETYLDAVREAIPAGRLQVMTSAGGMQSATGFRPKESLLSGPAGGVVGAAHAGRLSGREKVISFDMGGTSTDVARYQGDFDYRFETRVGEARILAPALAIETVAAGGGSVCRFDGRQLKVGPDSAGAAPGPACYGAGGPLTLTDVNLLLGRLDPEQFEIPIVGEAAEAALASLQVEMEAAGEDLDAETVLSGLLSIANERMAEAIRRISVRRGYDPSEHTLVAFGGAGAQHATALAELLGMSAVLVPEDASLLSARGLGYALIERFAERQVLSPAEEYEPRLEDDLNELAHEAKRAVAEHGVPRQEIEVRRRMLSLRLGGQESTLTVEWSRGRPIVELFASAYVDRFGYPPPERQIEVESVRVVASSRQEAKAVTEQARPHDAEPQARRACWIDGTWREVAVFERERLRPGARWEGPALVGERFSAAVVERGWRGTVDAQRALLLERREA